MAASNNFLVPSVGVGGVVFYVVVFCVLLLVPFWIASDASRRGDSGLAWGLVAFMLGPIGWVIYLARRRPVANM